MCGINAVGAQGSGCMFTLCHAPLKMAVLLHKTEKVWDSFSETVYTDCFINFSLTKKKSATFLELLSDKTRLETLES